ncbi:MAG: hypothetical protein NkDv07_0614 [Candidatus Improbicoccus devescovinae]|nr:MAG: hypothetical protein NkDv07_0614 [Candidatus Improbicoccus devescovinae]
MSVKKNLAILMSMAILTTYTPTNILARTSVVPSYETSNYTEEEPQYLMARKPKRQHHAPQEAENNLSDNNSPVEAANTEDPQTSSPDKTDGVFDRLLRRIQNRDKSKDTVRMAIAGTGLGLGTAIIIGLVFWNSGRKGTDPQQQSQTTSLGRSTFTIGEYTLETYYHSDGSKMSYFKKNGITIKTIYTPQNSNVKSLIELIAEYTINPLMTDHPRDVNAVITENTATEDDNSQQIRQKLYNLAREYGENGQKENGDKIIKTMGEGLKKLNHGITQPANYMPVVLAANAVVALDPPSGSSEYNSTLESLAEVVGRIMDYIEKSYQDKEILKQLATYSIFDARSVLAPFDNASVLHHFMHVLASIARFSKSSVSSSRSKWQAAGARAENLCQTIYTYSVNKEYEETIKQIKDKHFMDNPASTLSKLKTIKSHVSKRAEVRPSSALDGHLATKWALSNYPPPNPKISGSLAIHLPDSTVTELTNKITTKIAEIKKRKEEEEKSIKTTKDLLQTLNQHHTEWTSRSEEAEQIADLIDSKIKRAKTQLEEFNKIEDDTYKKVAEHINKESPGSVDASYIFSSNYFVHLSGYSGDRSKPLPKLKSDLKNAAELKIKKWELDLEIYQKKAAKEKEPEASNASSSVSSEDNVSHRGV